VNAATTVKFGISASWALFVSAAFMLLLVTDSYRGGYEDMVSDASTLFLAGATIAGCAVACAIFLRRKKPGSISGAWLVSGGVHLALSVLLLTTAIILTRISP
jgi:hypothetical protein